MVVAREMVYKTQFKQIRGLNAIEDDTSPNLWHRRLAYLNGKGLQILARKSLILYAKDTRLNPCVIVCLASIIGCLLAKYRS